VAKVGTSNPDRTISLEGCSELVGNNNDNGCENGWLERIQSEVREIRNLQFLFWYRKTDCAVKATE